MKKSVLIKSIAAFLLAVVVFVTGNVQSAFAYEAPYVTYNYDYREDIVYTPAAYVPDSTITTLGMLYEGEEVGALNSPQDLCKTQDDKVVIADTNNNRIIYMNSDMTAVEKIITTFDNNGEEDEFKAPYGVAVNEENHLYVADSRNRRIVVLDESGKLLQIVENPTSEVLEENFVFTPLKVCVDYANRIYCIAQNQFEGIMVFEANGEFTGFFGTIEVQISLWERFWRKLATKEERANQQLYIPTEFTGIDIDPDGFVYASNIDPDAAQGVRRLNPKGEDVIKKGENENLGGDLWVDGTTEYAGPSQFTDVLYRENGIYSCLDRKRGRIFTYDHEGNLLYIFGGIGTQEGTFKLPVAIDQVGENLVVLDATTAKIICFKATEYGALINEAVSLRYDGDETEAVALWERVLELDGNNELANSGIGKAYLTAGDYVSAMKYLKLGMNREYYSIAFRRYRNGLLADNVGYALTAVMVLAVAVVIVRFVNKKKRGVA